MRIPLRERIGVQADSFRLDVSASMRYVLLLNGVVANAPGRPATVTDIVGSSVGVHGPQWLIDSLSVVAPDALPGECGPVIVTLIL